MTEATQSDAFLALAADVRERLWRYLSASADLVSLAPVVEGLFRLPRGEARRLAAAHLALSPSTEEMLDAAERLLRELPSSVTREEVEAPGRCAPADRLGEHARHPHAHGAPGGVRHPAP